MHDAERLESPPSRVKTSEQQSYTRTFATYFTQKEIEWLKDSPLRAIYVHSLVVRCKGSVRFSKWCECQMEPFSFFPG